jgi:Fe2+ transport system protein FeoA
MKLSDVPIHQKSQISGFEDEVMAAKLLEMGLLPGCRIEILRTAPLGCPLYVKVGNHRLAIRKKEAENILVS